MKSGLLSVLWALPALGALVTWNLRARRTALALATLVAALMTGLGAAVFLASLRASAIGRVDGFSAILLPLVGALTLGALVASPRASLDGRSISGTLLTASATLGALVADNALAFAAFWALSVAPLAFESRRSGDVALRRAVRLLVGVGVAPMCAAMALAAWAGARHGVPWRADLATLGASAGVRAYGPALGAVVLVSSLARLGSFPFHAWVPVALRRGSLPLALPVVVSPLGSFALVRLLLALLPGFFEAARPWLLGFGAASMVYGALLALGQHDARRQLGFLWVSIAGMVVMGLGSFRVGGMSGALLHEMTAMLSVSGILWALAGVEARTGTLDMRLLGGLVRRTPWLATAYLLLGLATVGIPGTVTFVSEDLLVQGLLHDHALLAGLFLLVAALNGVTLVRSFQRIFLGPTSAHATDVEHVEDMLPRERWVAALVILALLAGGFAPAPALSVRAGVLATLGARHAPDELSDAP